MGEGGGVGGEEFSYFSGLSRVHKNFARENYEYCSLCIILQWAGHLSAS